MRTVYLSLEECYGYIERALKPFIGVVAEIADHRPFLECILDHYCHGQSLTGFNEYDQLTQYRLPSETANTVITNVRHDILKMIMQGFQITYPTRLYAYRMMDTDVVITETEVTFLTVEAGPKPDDRLDHDDGYTPERLRQRS